MCEIGGDLCLSSLASCQARSPFGEAKCIGTSNGKANLYFPRATDGAEDEELPMIRRQSCNDCSAQLDIH